TAAPFKEGDVVQKGQLLFQIDKRPYEADLNQAQANLNVAIADRNLFKRNADRIQKLPPDNTTREEYETVLAAYEKAGAQVAAAQAAVERAKLNLSFCSVTAPETGRISRRLVDPGNLVNADSTLLTNMVVENPIYAYFDVDERAFLDIISYIVPREASWVEGMRLPVLVRVTNEPEFERLGYVDFVDNRVVATTGTVRMRGVFANPQYALKPGL